jgi:hypothetical protein
MAIDFGFREKAVRQLITQIGVYVLCDLDKVPVYVGKSKDGIRARVRRHLTSARSDIIANRQIDVWEIAYVMAYPVQEPTDLTKLEAFLIHHCDAQSTLMQGQMPAKPSWSGPIPQPAQTVQVMSSDEISEKLDPSLRLPRQAGRYAEIVSHFIAVKNSDHVARAMHAHFRRLSKYHSMLLKLPTKTDESEE